MRSGDDPANPHAVHGNNTRSHGELVRPNSVTARLGTSVRTQKASLGLLLLRRPRCETQTPYWRYTHRNWNALPAG